MFDEQVAGTKDDYDDYDRLFNSTRICKVEDHFSQEHMCDCVRTDRNLIMLEQNLKGQCRMANLDWIIPVAEKSNVRERY